MRSSERNRTNGSEPWCTSIQFELQDAIVGRASSMMMGMCCVNVGDYEKRSMMTMDQREERDAESDNRGFRRTRRGCWAELALEWMEYE